jgi:hypothetical protein
MENIRKRNFTVIWLFYSREYLALMLITIIFMCQCRYIYLNSEPVNAWFLELHAGKAAKILLEEIRESHRAKNSAALQQAYAETKYSKDVIASNILNVIVNCTANWSKGKIANCNNI